MSTKEILFPYPENSFPKNSCPEKHLCVLGQHYGSIIAVSAMIAMSSVLSSFGKARNHEPTNIKGET
ncbi:hypothetical protein CEXT_452501 [Caerostris extrusa]|uniref:Uncharacterized protein n=1 Tax=Caerostris extrusa TaxID=172846 RepID=A0AAV4TFZ8_CAEEX|nr:hypothetical protein CEXT_452501 [Caerostris extrusa]